MKGGNTKKMVSVPGEKEHREAEQETEVRKGNNVHCPLYEITRHCSEYQLMRNSSIPLFLVLD